MFPQSKIFKIVENFGIILNKIEFENKGTYFCTQPLAYKGIYMKSLTKGDVGELLISDFFDKNFSKIYSFPNPKTKDNAEIADVLIWLNRTVFLIEVKTRDEGTSSIESWAHSRIKKAYHQIDKNNQRIKSNERISLKNDYYHTILDCEEIVQIIGLIVLVTEEECIIEPTQYLPEIYDNEIPIHVIMWNDLKLMIEEIDTVPDFNYYLQDRFNYLKKSLLVTGQELDILGYYKSKSNKFPDKVFDFSNQWENYQKIMKPHISIRDEHNIYSNSIDKLEEEFISQRKLFENIPLGMYFAWELGNLSRREKSYYGEKIYSVFEHFSKTNKSRKFSFQSANTKNWLLFHFYKSSEKIPQNELERLCELKLVKEVYYNSFEYGIYAFSFEISDEFPYQIKNIHSAIMMGIDAIKDIYNEKTIAQAIREFGDNTSYSEINIREFIDL